MCVICSGNHSDQLELRSQKLLETCTPADPWGTRLGAPWAALTHLVQSPRLPS